MDSIEQRLDEIERFNIFVGDVLVDILLPSIRDGSMPPRQREQLAHALGAIATSRSRPARVAHAVLTEALSRHGSVRALEGPDEPRGPATDG